MGKEAHRAMSDKMFAVVYAALLFLLLTVTICIIVKNKKKKHVVYEKYRKGNTLPFAAFIYTAFWRFPVINRYFMRIKKKFEFLFPGDAYTATDMAVRLMAKALLAAVACIIFVVWVSGGDMFFITTSLFVVAIIVSNYVLNNFNRLNYRLLGELRGFLDNVRHYYYETNQPDDAVLLAMDASPHEFRLHADFFYNIASSPEPFAEAEKYSETAPNRFFATFASICAFIKEYGDDVVDGSSVFLKNTEYLKEVISDELIRLDFVNNIFAGLVFVCIFPVVFIKPVEMWGISVMPDMKEFYLGTAGLVTTGIIYVVTIVAYELIVSMRDGRMREEEYHPVIDRLLGNRHIKHFAELHDNFNASATEKTGRMLKSTGSSIGTQGFFIQRLIVAAAVFIIMNSAAFYLVANRMEMLINDYAGEFTQSIIPDDGYRETMREIAKDYGNNYRYVRNADEELLITEMTAGGAVNETYARMIVSVIKERAEEAYGSHYRWYMLLMAMAGAAAAYYIPYLLLLYKNRMAAAERQTEVEQFQTLAVMLMNMDGITVNTVLEWMNQFSFCFREDIDRCIMMLDVSEKEALEALKNTDYMPFGNFVDCLLSIDRVGIREAFSEIEKERKYNRTKSGQSIKHAMEKRSRLAGTIAFIPLYAVLYGYLIIPFLIYAMKMLDGFGTVL